MIKFMEEGLGSMLFDEIYKKANKVYGWMSKEDSNVLSRYASKVKNGLIVELGCFQGRSSTVISLSSPTSKVVSVDPLQPEYVYSSGSKKLTKRNSNRFTGNEVREFLTKNMKDIKNWEFYQESSLEVGKGWELPIDMLFIDSRHDYEYVKAESLIWLPYVKSGSYVLYHDYYDDSPDTRGVKKAVDELVDYFSEMKRDPYSYIKICKKK